MEVFCEHSYETQYSHMLDHYPKPFVTNLLNHLFLSSRSFSQTIRHIRKLTYLIPYLQCSQATAF